MDPGAAVRVAGLVAVAPIAGFFAVAPIWGLFAVAPIAEPGFAEAELIRNRALGEGT